MRYECGFSFSYDQRELAQEVMLRLANSKWRVFMFDGEMQEGGYLWEWLQEKYLSCDRIAVFMNDRYLARPVTRREFQFFSANSERWLDGRIQVFAKAQMGGTLLFSSGFPSRDLQSADEIAKVLLGT